MAAAIAGWSSNKLKDTKYPMLFGKAMAILSCITYMAIELVGSDLKPAFFLVFELLLGIAVGAANKFLLFVQWLSLLL